MFRPTVFWVLLSGAAVAALHLVVLIAIGLREIDEPVDVAVILGNEVYPDGRLSPRLRARVDRAIELYEDGLYAFIIASGGVDENGISEGTAMKGYLREHVVPDSSIIVDDRGTSTWQTAQNVAAIMNDHGWRSVVVVTQYFHVARSRYSFRAFGVETTAGAYPRHMELRDLYSLPREVVAMYVYLGR